MKKLLILATFLLVLCSVSLAQITMVSQTGGSGGTTLVTSPALNTTGASVIVVGCGSSTGTGSVSSASPSGLSFTALNQYTGAGYAGKVQFFCANTSGNTGSAQTLSCSNTMSGGLIQVFAISGTACSAVDGQSGSSDATTPGSITPTTSSDLFLSIAGDYFQDGYPFTVSGPFTLNNSNNYGAGAYYQSASLAAQNPTWSYNGNDQVLAMVAFKASAAAPALTATPSTVPSSHSTNISLALTCSTCSWTGSTTFSVSGVTGAAFVSKTNNSATSETIVITTGSGTGTLTITGSDTSTGTITVSTPALAISPTTATTGTTPTVTLTGTNTLWATDISAGNFTTSSLFSASGSTGASIGSCTISSNMAASCLLTAGSTAATDTVTDNSTTKTATVTVSSGTTYALTTATTGTGSGTVSGCARNYVAGATYTCTVTPSTGSTLASVSGCGGSGTTTYTGSMPSNACVVTATFTLNTYALTVATSGTGSGSISGTNCSSATYNYNTSIGACTATPSGGSVFAGWSGTGSASGVSGTGTASFSLTSPSSLTATFNNTTSGGGVVIR